MKVIFCLDHKPSYLLLLKAAVRSLRAVPPGADCLCVYAGADPALQATLATENIPVARHRPRITPGGLSPTDNAVRTCASTTSTTYAASGRTPCARTNAPRPKAGKRP